MLPSPAVNLLCEKAIKAIAAGKPEEIGVIYDHTYRLIYSVAYGVLQNHGDAEDAAQETLCEILRCASSYQGGSAKGWILSIARHKALDAVKKQSRLLPGVMEEFPAEGTPKDMVEEAVICLDALNSLGETEREVVILRVYCKCRHKEIASLLGITAASAEKHYQRGLEKLRSYYGEGRNP